MPAGLRESDDSHFIAHFLAGAEETFAIVSVGSLCENLAVEIKKKRQNVALSHFHSLFFLSPPTPLYSSSLRGCLVH